MDNRIFSYYDNYCCICIHDISRKKRVNTKFAILNRYAVKYYMITIKNIYNTSIITILT